MHTQTTTAALLSFSLSLLLLPTLTLATPLAQPIQNTRKSTSDSASAKIISYFVATACDSPYNQATQTLSSNVCMDLGEDDTTRSIAVYDVSGGTGCTVQVWEDESCTSAYNEVVNMEVGSSEVDKTCVDEPEWGDGSTTMGSVMLVCG